MNHKQLEYAIALSECLNFSQVADRFRISQPALSKQISNLEKKLGVELFSRDTNPIRLSAAGEHFIAEAKKLLYQEKQLYRSMEEFKSEQCGNLIIGISPFRSQYLLTELTQELRKSYPQVKIILQEDSSDQLRKKAAEGKYDFAVVNLPVDEAILNTIPIERDTLVLAIPQNLLSKTNIAQKDSLSPISIKDCNKLPFVVVGQNQEMRILFDKLCAASDYEPHIAMEVVGIATAWTMAKAGIGATLIPLQFVKNTDPNHSMHLFLPKNIPSVRQPAIILRNGQYLSEYAKEAIRILTKQS